MNESLFATKDYKNETTLRLEQNKPNQSQSQTGHQLVNRMNTKLLNFHLKIRKKLKNPQYSTLLLPALKLEAIYLRTGKNAYESHFIACWKC